MRDLNIIQKVALLLLVLTIFSCRVDESEFTLLAWVGYNEQDIKKHLEENIDGLELSVITYTGGEDMLNKYLSNKEEIDLIVVDAEYGKLLFERGELRSFTLNDLPLAKLNVQNNYFEKFKNSTNEETPGHILASDSMYCLTVRWGTVGLVADTILKERIDSIGYSILFESIQGKKIPVFDWYLPNMGVFSLMYLDSVGKSKNPYDLTAEELDQMYNMIMKPIGENISGFYGDLGLVINNVFEPESFASPGVGEWAIGNSVLSGDNTKMDWYIPSEGGIMWIEALAIPKGNNKEKVQMAFNIMNEFSSAKFQSILAWRDAYTSHVPNKNAYKYMSIEQQRVLKYNELEAMMNSLYYRKLPSSNIRKSWIDYWARYKTNQ